MKLIKFCITITLFQLIFACNSSEQSSHINQAVSFEKSDECHVCGMLITRFNGPKGQAFNTKNDHVKKFCSTAELIFWVLQPENLSTVSEIYVHDMSKSAWDNPEDSTLISAYDAYFVIGSNIQGSMGKTFASFSSTTDAEKFANINGGQVITFNLLTLDVFSK